MSRGSGSYEGNVERFSGFADGYDRHRYRPPPVLAEILCRYADTRRPDLVVDLGCGTGPSTRFWQDRAGRVVGIEPSPDMLRHAVAHTEAASVEYKRGYGHDTGLPDGSVDIITCSQSFHWMEPISTLAEVERILRPGGVFGAYHYHACAVTGIVDLDRAVEATSDRIFGLEVRHRLKDATLYFGKERHARSLADSGVFSFVREILLHSIDTTSAERILGGFNSCGAVQSLRDKGLGDEDLGLADLAVTLDKHLGGDTVPVYVSYQVCVGVRPAGHPPDGSSPGRARG